MNRSKIFPLQPIGDSIIVERLNIKSVQEKKAQKSDIVLPQLNSTPKNILDMEKKRAEEISTYEDAETNILKMWDENPNQAVIHAVGPGRDIGNGVIIKPQVKVGQHVFYRGRSGEPIVVNKKLYWIIKEFDIFGVVPVASNIK